MDDFLMGYQIDDYHWQSFSFEFKNEEDSQKDDTDCFVKEKQKNFDFS